MKEIQSRNPTNIQTPIFGIIGICRPFWAFFLTYCYFLFLFIIIERDALVSTILGFLTMFSFYLGHFSLNAIYDKESDRRNPRKNIFSSWDNASGIKIWQIWLMIAFFWGFSFVGSLIHFLVFQKLLPIFVILAILLAIIYSVPPIQTKGRAPWDLVTDQLSFGILGPLYTIESSSPSLLFTPGEMILILLFSTSSLTIFVMPTIMMDTKTDRQSGLNTFSVRYGIKNSLRAISISVIFQIMSLIGFVWHFMLSENYLGVIVITIFLYGERQILFLLYDPYASDIIFESVAKKLTHAFLVVGTALLGFILAINQIDFDVNSLLKNYRL